MRIVVLDGYTENPGDLSWEGVREFGDLTVYDRTEAKDLEERIKDADVILTNKTPLSREAIASAPKLKFISVLATGYNVVDIDAARERGVPVSNVPTYGTTAVAQYVFALLLELCHHVGHHNQAVQTGRWSEGTDFCFWDYPLIELAGQTMGIIGYGRIGRATGAIAKSFGMRVLAHDNYIDAEECVSLSELLEKSDVVSLHCPLFPETEGLISRKTIDQMKDGVIIINTSRGLLINEKDLRDALLSKKVYGAAVDVVSEEPIRRDNPLLGLDNCIITPHIAWAPKESRQRLMDITVGNLKAFASGKPVNVVNS